MTLRLRFPTEQDETRVLELDAAVSTENFSFLAGHTVDGETTWQDVLATLRHEHDGTALPPDRVPADFLLAVLPGGTDHENEQIIGRASIRYELTDYLRKYDGHIGYAVAPEHRRKGYATEILRQSLALLSARGTDKALVTCDDDNVGSARVIETCGGVLENTTSEPDGVLKRRYWIDLARTGPSTPT
jgi:predicted acetyltransferase